MAGPMSNVEDECIELITAQVDFEAMNAAQRMAERNLETARRRVEVVSEKLSVRCKAHEGFAILVHQVRDASPKVVSNENGAVKILDVKIPVTDK